MDLESLNELFQSELLKTQPWLLACNYQASLDYNDDDDMCVFRLQIWTPDKPRTRTNDKIPGKRFGYQTIEPSETFWSSALPTGVIRAITMLLTEGIKAAIVNEASKYVSRSVQGR